MTIRRNAEPARGRGIVHNALSQRAHRFQYVPVLRGSPQIGAPLPIYLLSRDGASLPVPLSAAKMVGWRYPIIGGSAVGLASLLKEPDGLKFAGISQGTLPERLLNAAVLADEKLGSRTKKFEPRLLEIPSLRIYALWLYASRGQSFFIPLMDGHPPGSSPLQIEGNIQPKISAALDAVAATMLRRSQLSNAGGPPSN